MFDKNGYIEKDEKFYINALSKMIVRGCKRGAIDHQEVKDLLDSYVRRKTVDNSPDYT